jgi:hypothetical protein
MYRGALDRQKNSKTETNGRQKKHVEGNTGPTEQLGKQRETKTGRQ